jgi:cytidine deaminase
VVLPDMPATPLQDLLPHAFGPRDLGIDAALMSPQSHHLTLTGAIDDLTRAALDAANASYAPYSHSYAGVALRTSDGAIHTGGIAENAAFNPSLSPLEAAIVTMSIRGGKTYADLTDAVLVEVANAKASQAGAARAVLETLTTAPLRVYTAQ